MEKAVTRLTTVWKNSTILTSIRQSSVHPTLTAPGSASMVSFALSLTTSASYLLSSLRSSSQTWISTYSTSRQYGAHTEKMTMKEMSAFTRTTGRITEENLQYSATLKTCAKIGTLRTSSRLTKMAAPLSIGAPPAMAGKSRNSIQITSSSSSVCTETHARSRIARTFIRI